MTFPYRGETQELNEETRKEAASGAFVRLSDGVTHYELSSPLPVGEGLGVRLVVLVHGFSVPYFIFDPTFDYLVQSGFRVLRYDLFGRGFSDRPRTNYNIQLFVQQLADLMDALNITEPVDVVGLSMGGPVTAAFVEKYAGRVRMHVLIDPAGARAVALTSALKAVKIKFVGELLLSLIGNESLLKSAAADFFDPALIEEFKSRYAVQMQYKGFKHALLSSMRSGMLDSFYETYQRVGKLQKPTLLFWGRDDMTVPFDHSADMMAALPHAEFHIIEKCGHIPHYEKPEIVNPILKKFLCASS